MFRRLPKPWLLVQIKPRLRKSPKVRPHESAPQISSCHSERSEAESKNLRFNRLVLTSASNAEMLRHSLSMILAAFARVASRQASEVGASYQTALAEIAEITAGGALHQVDGELEQTNFPRVVYALDDRAERFVFVFDLPPGAIDHRID